LSLPASLCGNSVLPVGYIQLPPVDEDLVLPRRALQRTMVRHVTEIRFRHWPKPTVACHDLSCQVHDLRDGGCSIRNLDHTEQAYGPGAARRIHTHPDKLHHSLQNVESGVRRRQPFAEIVSLLTVSCLVGRKDLLPSSALEFNQLTMSSID